MTITLPDEMKPLVEAEAARAGYSSVDDYVCAVLREAKHRQTAIGPIPCADFFNTHTDLDALAAAQGVQGVVNVDDLYGDFWPEDESVDEFLAAVREWRREGHGGNQ